MLKLLAVMMGFIFCGSRLVAEDDMQLLAKGNSTFAFDLYHRLSGKEGNLFFSPYSISTALGMTYAGARGETARQMAQALHFSLPEDKLPLAFAGLRKHLDDAQGDDKVTLNIANSIWPSDRVKILESYIGLLKNDYGVSVTPLDYRQPVTASGRINRWVETNTHGKIKDLISPGVLTPETTLTLVNAIYFYGKWLDPFQPGDTEDWGFQVGRDKKVEVPMMKQEGGFQYADTGALQVLELPYRGGDISMLIVLPNAKDGLGAVESNLSGVTLRDWRTKLASTQVVVRLPKFKMTWGSAVLNRELGALGMTDAFDQATSDFSGMDGNPHGFVIGAVVHKAMIEVKEEGTEAAAATGVVAMTAMARRPIDTVFLADHPFLFLIQDRETESILFMGRVVDPSAGE